MPEMVQMRVLQRAAERLGGFEALRARLNVSRLKLEAWMKGRSKLPDAVFLRVVDLLAADEEEPQRPRDTA